jgi:hypothetical protein
LPKDEKGRGRRRWGAIANGYEVCFAVIIVMVVAQLCEYTKLVQFKWMSSMVYGLYLNIDPVFKNTSFSQAPVARACNPSYWGGRGQEDCDLKPDLGK